MFNSEADYNVAVVEANGTFLYNKFLENIEENLFESGNGLEAEHILNLEKLQSLIIKIYPDATRSDVQRDDDDFELKGRIFIIPYKL